MPQRRITGATAAENSDPPASWWRRGEPLLVLAVCFLLAGDPPPSANEAHYMCRVQHHADPSYCAGDMFLESPDAHVAFVYATSWLTPWLSLPALAWCGRLVCWGSLSLAWCRLVARATPRWGVATLTAAVWLVLIQQHQLAGEWIVGGFEAKCLAWLLVVLSITAVVDRRWNWAWTFVGAATAWHALVGGWGAVCLALAWCLEPRRPLLRMWPGVLAAVALGSIGVVPALLLARDAPPEVAAQAAEYYVFVRLSHHLALLSKPAEWIAAGVWRNLFVVVLFAISCLWVARRNNPRDRALHIVNQFAAGALLLAITGFAIELLLADHPRLAASLLRYYWYRMADVLVPIAVAITLGIWLVELFQQRRGLATIALACLLGLVGWPIGQAVVARVANPVSFADSRVSEPVDWLAACEWIAANTPPDALFLTPRGNSSFKWHAERAEVVTYKDVPQDAPTLIKWHQRLTDVHSYSGDPAFPFCDSLGQLGTARIINLARKYQFDYLLTENTYPLALPIVYANDTYIVYQLGPAADAP